MIELACPKCNTDLDIDEAFSGSVCRCFKCGTLFIVPKNEDANAQELTRPARPEAPGMAADGTYDLAPYSTPTGQSIKITPDQLDRIPVAQQHKKRMIVRGTTVAVVIAILLALFIGVGYGFYILFRGEPEPTTQQIHSETFDIVDNPYFATTPNFFTLPVGARNVFMFDSSAAMSRHIDAVRTAVNIAVATLGQQNHVQVMAWDEQGPTIFPARLAPAPDISIDALADSLEALFPQGPPTPADTFDRAIEANATHIFLVLRNAPPTNSISRYAGVLEEMGTIVTIIQIDSTDAQLKAFAEQTGGQHLQLPAGRLQAWYDDFMTTPAPLP